MAVRFVGMTARETELAGETGRLWEAFGEVLSSVGNDLAGASDVLDTIRTIPEARIKLRSSFNLSRA